LLTGINCSFRQPGGNRAGLFVVAGRRVLQSSFSAPFAAMIAELKGLQVFYLEEESAPLERVGKKREEVEKKKTDPPRCFGAF
jgi:hypothetical protein